MLGYTQSSVPTLDENSLVLRNFISIKISSISRRLKNSLEQMSGWGNISDDQVSNNNNIIEFIASRKVCLFRYSVRLMKKMEMSNLVFRGIS